jgi:hypothetical protein
MALFRLLAVVSPPASLNHAITHHAHQTAAVRGYIQ